MFIHLGRSMHRNVIIIRMMYTGSMSVDAPSTIRPANNPIRRIVHITDVPICSSPIVNEGIIRRLANAIAFSISESRAKSTPMKNMKNSPVAPSMLVQTIPMKLLNGMLML